MTDPTAGTVREGTTGVEGEEWKDGKKYGSYEAVYDAFFQIFAEAGHRGLAVHYPQVGAGLAGGDWATIQACIDAAYDAASVETGATPERTLWIFE